MKQKLLFVLSLAAMALGSEVTMAAGRVAPTMPSGKTPTSGQTYYVYNVEADMFMHTTANSTSYIGVRQDEAEPVKVTKESNGDYSLFYTNLTYGYVYSNAADYARMDGYKSLNNYCYWTLKKVSGSYTIQRSTANTNYYNANEYLGWVGDTSSDYVYANRASDGAIHWKFFTIADGDRYMAERRLYHALQSSEAYISQGWNLDYYENAYTNRASASNDDLNTLARQLNNGLGMSSGYEAPEWNEYPILFQTSDGTYGQSVHYTWALPNNSNKTGTYFERYLAANSTSTLSATVSVDEEATFVYEINSPRFAFSVEVYVDDIKMRNFGDWSVDNNSFSYAGSHDRFFEKLSAGTHTIKWVYNNTATSRQSVYIYNVGCVATPLISVNLLEAGSLGTEVLYNTDHIKNVKRLKISGPMNSDDWAKIQMMTNLFELDIKDAIVETIPNRLCDGDNSATAKKFLNKVILPDALKSIGEYAFHYTYVEDVTFQENLTTIGEGAFKNTHLKEVILPDNFETMGEYAFAYSYQLKLANLGKKITTIPRRAFSNIHRMQVIMPNTVTSIGQYAFYYCDGMKLDALPSSLTTVEREAFGYCHSLNAKFPEGLTSIGAYAFELNYALDSLYIPSSVNYIGQNAFDACSNLKYVELPVLYYTIAQSDIFTNCNSLNRVRLKSPTVVLHPKTLGRDLANITLEVPSFLVNSYKLDEYWYNAKAIEGFSTAEIQDWKIQMPLVLNARDRFEGTPNIVISGGYDRLPSLKINGEAAQEINNLNFYGNRKNYVNYPGQILVNSNNVKVKGTVRTDLETDAKRWFFFSLPFDTKVSDIIHGSATTQFAIRYYDGANRAANGASGSWKNYNADDIIPAGTGFIFQTNVDDWNGFYAVNNASKQNVVSNKEFTKTLEVNASANAANKGWNLIGNPYQCYYNNHMLNFTAPITVWNASSRTYTAYSLTDDDYAIRPNEAFFVQCPSAELNTISFPLQGRQLNATIESQNAAKVRDAQAFLNRQLVDLEVSDGELADKTRVVVNENVTLAYDMECDASKFMSSESEAPQIYTIGTDGTEYAINERPLGEGEVQLGFYTQRAGAFTLSMPRCDAKKVLLVDTFENLTVDLAAQDYGFTATTGKQDGRFRLLLEANDATDIATVEAEQLKASATEGGISVSGMSGVARVYTLDGRLIKSQNVADSETVRVPNGAYIVRLGSKAVKVIVK